MTAADQAGLVTIPSRHPVSQTIDRLVDAATAAGLRIFARIDHGAGAQAAGMPLRPTELLIFGHPEGGTPLMQDRQTAGIDLPVKALAWADAEERVWLSYDDPHWIARRHGLSPASDPSVEAIASGLASLAAVATGD
jgi:uncharacterized protein (DUF302 family)